LNFSDIPEVVIDYVRERFAVANAKVTRTLETQPSMYEETLDHLLVMELTASPPVFFAAEQIGLSIESHCLGSRWMYGRWEIADIAFFITLRQRGRLEARKVALLQTKRLYSKEIDVAELEDADYRIGIGRLADRIDPQVPLSQPRWFSFDADSVYGAMRAGHEQVQRIDAIWESATCRSITASITRLYCPFAPPIRKRPMRRRIRTRSAAGSFRHPRFMRRSTRCRSGSTRASGT